MSSTAFRSTAACLLAVTATWLAVRFAYADPEASVNATRMAGCDGERAADSLLQRSAALDDVARALARSGRLDEAVDRVGYRLASSTSLYVRGPTDDAAIREIIADRYCTTVSDPRFTEIGVHRSGSETWIVLAAPAEAPAVENAAEVEARVLALVNAARAEPRRCGRRRHESAQPLTLSGALTGAALRHARDMAERGELDHRGTDGSQPAERAARAGYRWRAIGENIAAGQTNADAVVAAWLESPGHCANIMGAQFTQMGLAFALAPSGNPSVYWAQLFGTPR